MAKRLTAIIPTVVFDVRAGSRELHGVDVVVDGKGVEEGTEDARPVSIDPGEHTLTFHASGYAEVSRKVSFSAGDHDVRLTVDLAAPSTAEASSPRTTAGSGPSPLRVASIVTGGVAVVLLGTGVFFGVRAASRYSDATTNHCDQASPPACDRTGYDLGQDAHADARWSTIAVAVAVPLKSLSPAPRFAGLDAAA